MAQPQPPPPLVRDEHAFAPAQAPPKATPSESLLPAFSPYHRRSEQIRLLRTELLLRHGDPARANLVTVLSAQPGEGRSRLAAELAIAFSQLGQPTLLVDADLRAPSQHVLFNADNSHGLARSLARPGPVPLHAVAGLPSLSLLTAGPTPANPIELLSDRQFENLVDEWSQRYQYVVFDTPAVARYADALAVATITGRVLPVSRAQHTPISDMRELMRRVAATRARVLGAVLNHF